MAVRATRLFRSTSERAEVSGCFVTLLSKYLLRIASPSTVPSPIMSLMIMGEQSTTQTSGDITGGDVVKVAKAIGAQQHRKLLRLATLRFAASNFLKKYNVYHVNPVRRLCNRTNVRFAQHLGNREQADVPMEHIVPDIVRGDAEGNAVRFAGEPYHSMAHFRLHL